MGLMDSYRRGATMVGVDYQAGGPGANYQVNVDDASGRRVKSGTDLDALGEWYTDMAMLPSTLYANIIVQGTGDIVAEYKNGTFTKVLDTTPIFPNKPPKQPPVVATAPPPRAPVDVGEYTVNIEPEPEVKRAGGDDGIGSGIVAGFIGLLGLFGLARKKKRRV